MRQVMGQSTPLLLRRVSFAARSFLRHGCRAGPVYAQEYRGWTYEFVALPRTPSPPGRLPKHTPDRLYAVGGGTPPEQRAGGAQPVRQERCRLFPHLVVQGSRGGSGAGSGAPIWIQGRELLFDRESGKRRG